MKTKIFGFVMLMMILAFGMIILGCDDGDGSSLGATLTLSGKVHVEVRDEGFIPFTPVTYAVYSGPSVTVRVYNSEETGTISAAGDFNFTMGSPREDLLETISDFEMFHEGEMFTNFNISNPNAKIFVLDSLIVRDGAEPTLGFLSRSIEQYTLTPSGSNFRVSMNLVNVNIYN